MCGGDEEDERSADEAGGRSTAELQMEMGRGRRWSREERNCAECNSIEDMRM